jgi:phosphomethylpyrimidine synthase
MCGPKFCSMEITQQVREFVAKSAAGLDAQAGMQQKSAEFVAAGAEVYRSE